jgi:hypothetical protein
LIYHPHTKYQAVVRKLAQHNIKVPTAHPDESKDSSAALQLSVGSQANLRQEHVEVGSSVNSSQQIGE